MKEPTNSPDTRRPRRGWKFPAVIVVAILGATLWYLNSSSFEEQVRQRVIAELETATGGRVELPTFTWHLSKLEFVAQDLTIHGTESPGEPPYAHVDYLKIRLKIVSLLSRKIGLSVLEAQHPVLHIAIRKDGTTNQPTPLIRTESEKPKGLIANIFDLAIDRVDINNGLLTWNNRKVQLDLHANDLSAHMAYDPTGRRYPGVISVGNSAMTLAGSHPLASNAEVRFAISKEMIQIDSLRWASPGSKVEASGRIVQLADPRLQMSYSGSISMAELGAFTRISGMRGGMMDVRATGEFWWDNELECQSSGDVSLKGFTWQDATVRVPDIDANAKFNLDATTLVFREIRGRVLGGTATGKAEVRNWTEHDPHPKATVKVTEFGSGNLQVSGINVGQVAMAFSTRQLPLSKLNAHGSADGSVRLAWRGSLDRADAALDIGVRAIPIVKGPPGLPVTGHLLGTYHMINDVMDIQRMNMETESTRITAAGVLGSESSRLDVKAQTENLHEWDPLISALGNTPEIPMRLQGKAAFTGSVGGRLAAPVVRGHLELASFESQIKLSPRPNAPLKSIHWDSLSADVQYSRQFIAVANGKIGRGSATVIFSGRAALLNGQVSDASAFQVQLEARDATLSDVQNIAGTSYPVSGKLNLVATASGTPVNLKGNGSFQVTAGSIYGQQFRSLRSGIRFTGQQVQLLNAILTEDGAQVSGNGAYNVSDGSFSFDARGNNIELGTLHFLQRSRLAVTGKADFEAKGSGTPQSPTINGSLNITQVVANGEAVGDVTATAVTHGRELELTARSQLRNAELNAKGNILLEGGFPGKLSLSFTRLDFDPLLRAFLAGRVTGHSAANGVVEAKGDFRRPEQLSVTGKIEDLSAEIEKIQLLNAGPIAFSYENGTLDLKRSHITGEDTDFFAEGTVSVVPQMRLNLTTNGRANLKLFQSLSPGLNSAGTAVLRLTITGTPTAPTLNGEVDVRQGAFSLPDIPNGLSEVNGTLVFNENRLQIRSLTARTGGGNLEIGGFVAYRRGLFFDLTAKGKDVRLRYPPGVSSAADADLHLAGTLQSSLLSGTVLVTRFGVNPKFDFAQYLTRAKQVPPTLTTASIVDNMRLDVHIVSTPQLEVETALAKITGDADLHIRGTLGRPAVLGRVNIVEGDVFFSNTKYHLERGDITFKNPIRIEPIFNIEASSRVQEYDITIGLHGTADNLSKQRTFRSDPPLPESDIIALLAFGRTREDAALSRNTNDISADTTSDAILGSALNAAISSRAQKLFGVSRIKIDPQIGGLESNPNARLTIEQQVNNNITLTYITNLASSAQQVIQAEYAVNKNFSIVLVRDKNGVFGFEVRVRQRKK